MTPADILTTGAWAALALCAIIPLLMWLADGVINAIEVLAQYE